VVLKASAAGKTIEKEIKEQVRAQIGPIATPDVVHITHDLPKTRSGKIMRRILRKVAAGSQAMEEMGDISTLLDPSIVKSLIDSRATYAGK